MKASIPKRLLTLRDKDKNGNHRHSKSSDGHKVCSLTPPLIPKLSLERQLPLIISASLQSRPLSSDLFSMFKNGSASQSGNDDEHKEKDKEKEAAKVGQSS
jgi:hypothetical protein